MKDDVVPGRSGWEFGERVRNQDGTWRVAIFHDVAKHGIRIEAPTPADLVGVAQQAIDQLYDERMRQFWPEVVQDDEAGGNVSPVR